MRQDGKGTFQEVYISLRISDSSYQEDEAKEALEFLTQPLLMIRQETDGTYTIAMSMYESKERLWFISQALPEPSTRESSQPSPNR